jgi:hypothetical protein
MMRAFLFASATAATFVLRLPINFFSQLKINGVRLD